MTGIKLRRKLIIFEKKNNTTSSNYLFSCTIYNVKASDEKLKLQNETCLRLLLPPINILCYKNFKENKSFSPKNNALFPKLPLYNDLNNLKIKYST